MSGIRDRVESCCVTVSRDLNRGETKFELKKDLVYRQLTKENEVSLQLVIPESFREKVLRLAHETLMSGNLGIKKTMDRVLTEFFGLGFVVMFLDFANLVIFVKGLFRKFMSLKSFWENCY